MKQFQPAPETAVLHPALKNLNDTINSLIGDLTALPSLTNALNFAYMQVNPNGNWKTWARESCSNPEATEELAIRYEEQALTFLADYLKWDLVNSRLLKGPSQLCEAIAAVIMAEKQESFAEKRELMQAQVLSASQFHEKLREERQKPDFTVPIVNLAIEIQHDAFQKLAKLFEGNLTYHGYSVKFAASGKRSGDSKSSRNKYLCRIPLPSDEVQEWPAATRLLKAIDNADSSYQQSLSCLSALNWKKRYCNQDEFCLDLIYALLKSAGRNSGRWGCVDGMLKADASRLLEYEKQRQFADFNARNFEAILKKLFDCLRESLSETSQLIARGKHWAKATSTLIMINNCLAADLQLSHSLRHLYVLRRASNYATEPPEARGSLEEAYRDVTQQYSETVKRLTKEAEQKNSTDQSSDKNDASVNSFLNR